LPAHGGDGSIRWMATATTVARGSPWSLLALTIARVGLCAAVDVDNVDKLMELLNK
jgi:hypothetical protein